MKHLDELVELGRPILVGPSRKRFIGAILDLPADQRVEGTAGAVAWLVSRGAHIVRVHDVREMARVVRVVDAIARAEA
jgi:dihydropteroate synthase